MPSPALVAFCVFGVISFFAVTAQLFMCIFALRAAEMPGGAEKPTTTPATALGPLTAQISTPADLEAPPPRRPSDAAARSSARGAPAACPARAAPTAGAARDNSPLSPVSEGAASSNGSSTVTCAHPESD